MYQLFCYRLYRAFPAKVVECIFAEEMLFLNIFKEHKWSRELISFFSENFQYTQLSQILKNLLSTSYSTHIFLFLLTHMCRHWAIFSITNAIPLFEFRITPHWVTIPCNNTRLKISDLFELEKKSSQVSQESYRMIIWICEPYLVINEINILAIILSKI